MNENNPVGDDIQIDDLAKRAEVLFPRRTVLGVAGKALVLPLLASICVTREAMGKSGSGDFGGDGDGDGDGDDGHDGVWH